MRKSKYLVGLLLSILALTSCNNNTASTSNSAPSIMGVKGFQCIVNTTVDFLDGVVALDKEDGDITPNLNITVSPTIEVSKDGYATFTKPGEYQVLYKVTDSEGRTAQKNSYIEVLTREEYLNFAMPSGFYSEVNGSAKFTECGMINGKFVVKGEGHQIAEDLKVNRQFSLKSNTLYTFKYTIDSQCAGKVKVLANNVYCGEAKLVVGGNILSFGHIVQSDEDYEDVVISLCFGNIVGNVDLVIEAVETTYPQNEGEEIDLTGDFDFGGRVEPNFNTSLPVRGNAFSTLDGKEGVLEVTASCTDIWEGGMFINTGVTLKEGTKYTISFDMDVEKEKYYEIVFRCGKWGGENNYTTEYMNPDYVDVKGPVVVEIEASIAKLDTLFIYVQSGTETNTIRMSNLKIIEHLNAYGRDTYPIQDYEEYHDSLIGEATFTSTLGAFKYHINKFGSVDSNEKVTSPAFFVNGSGGNYVLTFKAKASAPIEAVVAAPVKGGWDPTILWQRIYLNTEEQVFTFFMNANGADRDYTFVWQFGSDKNQAFENVDIDVYDVSICLRNRELDG